MDDYHKNLLSFELNQVGQENSQNQKQNLNLDNQDTKLYSPYEKNNKINNNSNKYSDQVEEFKRIKEQIDQITAVEKKLKNSESHFQETKNKLDHSQVPSAMRTSIYFGVKLFLIN